MNKPAQERVALIFLLVVLLIAALVSGAKASAAEVVVGSRWKATSTVLRPHQHVRLSCPGAMHGVSMDVAAQRPFALATGHWRDGGEAMQWTVNGSPVAYGKPSQTFGLSSVAFKSYDRSVAVEVICE